MFLLPISKDELAKPKRERKNEANRYICTSKSSNVHDVMGFNFNICITFNNKIALKAATSPLTCAKEH